MSPDVQAALAMALDPDQGETQLTLKWRQRGKPIDPIKQTIRRTVVRQLFDRHIAAGASRKNANFACRTVR
jgi:hypothetical protein